jgi:hypothetical protein
MGQVAASGVPASFKIEHAITGKSFNCIVYRPGESQSRLCVTIEEIVSSP